MINYKKYEGLKESLATTISSKLFQCQEIRGKKLSKI
jgi:hypothetical protein